MEYQLKNQKLLSELIDKEKIIKQIEIEYDKLIT